MLEDWGDRSAKVVTALEFCDENGSQVFVDKFSGAIAATPIGDNGFGYDPIFIPIGQNKTFTEMNDTEKDANSMRALATKAMKDQLG